MIPLTNKESKSYEKQNVSYICKKKSINDENEVTLNKKYQKVRDQCHYTWKIRGAAHNVCNLRYKTPKKISLAFHEGSTYDYHSIIKQLAKTFDG